MKKYIIGLITGLIIAGSIGVVAYNMAASDIEFDNTDAGIQSTDVQGAIEELFDKASRNRLTKIYSTTAIPSNYYPATLTNVFNKDYDKVLIMADHGSANQYNLAINITISGRTKTTLFNNAHRGGGTEVAIFENVKSTDSVQVYMQTSAAQFGVTIYAFE